MTDTRTSSAPLVFRQSDFRSFKDCRRTWAAGMRLGGAGLERKRVRPGTAGVGTLFHKGAEVYYLGGDGVAAIRQLHAADRLKVDEGYLDTYDKQLDLALAMFKGYVAWVAETGADVGMTVVGAESTLCVEWPGFPGVYVTGKLDLDLLDEFGNPKMIDFKTRASVEPQPDDNMDEQRLTYAVLKMLETGQLYAGLLHRYIKRVKRTGTAKPPFYAEHEVHVTLEQLRRHFTLLSTQLTEMVPLARGIQDGTITLDDPRLYPHVTKDCSWKCPFLDVCPMVDDGGDWQWALDAFFQPRSTDTMDSTEETA